MEKEPPKVLMNITRPLILASGSPRRQYLLREIGLQFTIEKPNVDEAFPADMPVQEVARYLALQKAAQFKNRLQNEIVITADTVVILDRHILNKPADRQEAISMLSHLSGQHHHVMTGVCLLSKEKEDAFEDVTEVVFKNLTQEEIIYYVDNHTPYDKAGAYGVQDWIGMVAIEKIIGSYFNVMGLPVHQVYTRLAAFS